MKTENAIVVIAVLAVLLVPVTALAQETKTEDAKKTEAPAPPEIEADHGFVDVGGRAIWGREYGRPDLPYDFNVRTSKFNEYRDVRDGLFIRRGLVSFDHLGGSDYWANIQMQRWLYRDQSTLAGFGRYNYGRVLFRYDEIPHRYSNTTRTLYTELAPGVWSIPALTRSALQSVAASPLEPITIQTQVVPSMAFFSPEITRRAGSVDGRYDFTPTWDAFGYFWREHESGKRPIGLVINSSPSAALTGGYGAELSEPIDYFTNSVRAGIDFDRHNWVAQLAYSGSFFNNRLHEMLFDNPFRTTDCRAPSAGCTAATQGPAVARTSLYPDNHANYLTFATAFDIFRKLRFMASITPGWLRQDSAFIPYTSNSLLLPLTGPLPSASLGGDKQTLAMNYTFLAQPFKKFDIKAAYRHYDYNNNTPVRTFTPVQGDISLPGTEENTPFGYNRKTVEVTGNYYLGKKSSFKAGYLGNIMDRSHRDVEHSLENSFISALDMQARKDLSFRLSYTYAVRRPDAYEDDHSLEIVGGIPEISPFARRFDQSARNRNRGDAWLEWTPQDRLGFTLFGATTQDNYNIGGHTNNSTPLGLFFPNSSPYFLYGVLKDLSYNYGLDIDFTVSPAATLFAEYSHEKYNKRMASRARTPGTGIPDGVSVPSNCGLVGAPCDSPNNDWGSIARDRIDIWTAGADLYLAKRTSLSTYYTLSAGRGNVLSFPLGNTGITTGPDRLILVGTNAAVNYPETTNRLHELAAVLKFKLTKNVLPRLEYRYQKWDYADYQTSAMTPYMGCVSAAPPAAPLPGCSTPILNSSTSAFPVGTPSPFYPFFVVGDPGAPRYLFLGADQPSYRVNYIAGTVEYHF